MASEAGKGAQVKAIPGTGEKKALKPAMRGDGQLDELSSNRWKVFIRQDVEPSDLEMHPTFWNCFADEYREGDEVKGIWTNGRHHALYEIVNVQNGVVAARLAWVVAGAPLVSAVGPHAFPAGYHIARATPEEGLGGYVVVREKDGMRMMTSGGVPWKTHQAAYEQFPKMAMFRNDEATRYTP